MLFLLDFAIINWALVLISLADPQADGINHF